MNALTVDEEVRLLHDFVLRYDTARLALPRKVRVEALRAIDEVIERYPPPAVPPDTLRRACDDAWERLQPTALWNIVLNLRLFVLWDIAWGVFTLSGIVTGYRALKERPYTLADVIVLLWCAAVIGVSLLGFTPLGPNPETGGAEIPREHVV